VTARGRAALQPGIPVDSGGGPTIDPTKNVGDLVQAESRYQDAMREAQEKLFNAKHDGLNNAVQIITNNVIVFQNAMRDSETRRLDQLAENRQEFQNTIRDMLAESVRTTSTLVSTQLVQIQATFDTRVSKLEAYQFTQAGRSSVADPALSEALTRLTSSLSLIQSKSDNAGGETRGKSESYVWLLATIMAIMAVASPIIAIFAMRGH
jgi:hypothetical protein